MEKFQGFMYRTEEEIAAALLAFDIAMRRISERQKKSGKKEPNPMEVAKTKALDLALDVLGVPADCCDFCDRSDTKKCPEYYMNSKRKCRKQAKFARDDLYDTWEEMSPDIGAFINHVKAEYFHEEDMGFDSL